MISFDATVTPQVIDQMKRWGLGVGYGDNGIAYKVDFPIGGKDYFGGWGNGEVLVIRPLMGI